MARGRVTGVNDIGTGVSAWYSTLPPVTRTYGTLVLLCTLLSFTLGILDLKLLALIWPRILKRFEVRRLRGGHDLGRLSTCWSPADPPGCCAARAAMWVLILHASVAVERSMHVQAPCMPAVSHSHNALRV